MCFVSKLSFPKVFFDILRIYFVLLSLHAIALDREQKVNLTQPAARDSAKVLTFQTSLTFYTR